MRHFLLVFDRVRRELLLEREFDDGAAALAERFRIERQGSWGGVPLTPDVEVVVLSAASPETLRLTHARYFMSGAEMIRAALG